MVLSLSAIGSCRVINPLRRGCTKQGLRFNQNRNYGFVHTSAEVVQQIKFMRGDWEPTPQIWRYISPGKQQDKMQSTKHEFSELYVVEISSLKKISLGDTIVQLNYITNLYPELFKNPEKNKQFWKIAEGSDSAVIEEFLLDCVRAGLISDEDVNDLRTVRIHNMGTDEIQRDVRWILDNLPRVIFQTHVDANFPDGSPSKRRTLTIESVKTAVAAENAEVYDPTELCRAYGQEKALEHGSSTHWSEPFMDALFDDMWTKFLSPDISTLNVPKFFTS